MSSKQRRFRVDAASFCEHLCRAEHFQFGFKVQAVAGFDFDRCDAFGNQAVQSVGSRFNQLLFRGGSC